MKVVVAGGTGFLGGALVDALRRDSHQVTVFTRSAPSRPGEVQWQPRLPPGPWARSLEGTDAVINLSGEPIAERRWTEARKRAILASRVDATRALVAAMRASGSAPATLLSGSAIGYYGTPGDEALDESAPAGPDFLAEVCREWEREAMQAGGTARVVLLRTGLVLAKDGGALQQLAMPFHFFVGGALGSGRQVMSWIHRDDWIAMVRWALTERSVSGPMNLTAPQPVTNREMATTLGRVLHRPSFMPAPAFTLRLVLGEMADAMILNGQRVLPRVAQRGGFTFRYETLEPALRAIYKGG
jgi:uncharacterized protein (TIGR01777 family)